MHRNQIRELHYITAISNVPSIIRYGILSHARARSLPHESIAMKEIQDRRSKVVVPNGRRLHDYVNLYFDARNPMLFKLLEHVNQLCILRIKPEVLDLRGVVISDKNASSEYARFAAAPNGLGIIDESLVFADDWTDPNPIFYYGKKSAKCAEVLVPDKIEHDLIIGGYIANDSARIKIEALGLNLPTTINKHIFFQET